MRWSVKRLWSALCPALAMLGAGSAHAGAEMRAAGKMLLTDGVSSVDGSAGGGLASWAVIGGNETVDGIGGSVHLTAVPLADFRLVSAGASLGLFDRLELSYTHQNFDTRQAGATLGLGHGFSFREDVAGAKLRVAGDAVYDQDTLMPQIAIGAEYRHADRGAVIHAIGGAHADGVDFTASATKILLARSLVIAATVRFTKANQFGLLGFGGDRHHRYTAQFEGSVGKLVTRRLLCGVEYRTKPDNLRFAREQDAWDLFAAYALTHNLSLTAAYVDLGDIATVRGQRGAFLSVKASF